MKAPFSFVVPAAVLAFAGGLALDLAASRAAPSPANDGPVDAAVLKAYQWRSIGRQRPLQVHQRRRHLDRDHA